MIVGLATPTFDLQGNILMQIDPAESELLDINQHVSRSDILSGGSVIKAWGFSDAAREMKLNLMLDSETENRLLYLVRHYIYLYMAVPDGFYSIVIRRLNRQQNIIVLNIVIKEKLA